MDGNASSPQDLDAINRELITTRERFTALECRHAEVQQQLSKDRQQLVETESVLGETAHLCEEQKKRIAELEEETAYWKKCLFGRRSERSESPDQGHLFDDLGKEEQEASEPAAEESESGSGNGKRRRKSGGWGKIPDHIPRVEVIIDLPESERFCSETGEPLVKIGEDRTEFLHPLGKVRFVRKVVLLLGIVRQVVQLFAVGPLAVTPPLVSQRVAELIAARHDTVGVLLLSDSFGVAEQRPQ